MIFLEIGESLKRTNGCEVNDTNTRDKMAKIRVLVAYPQVDMDGSAWHRVAVPSRELEHAGIEITHCDDFLDVPEAQLTNFDAVIVNRVITRKTVDEKVGNSLICTKEAIMRVHRSGIKVILDLDDTWNIPPSHPHYFLWQATQQRTAILLTIANAHLVWCSTLPLVKEVMHYNRANLHLVPNGINPLFDPQWYGLDKIPDPIIRLGVMCNQVHLPDVQGRLKSALSKLKKLTNWELVIIGVQDNMKELVMQQLRMVESNQVSFRPWLPVHQYANHYRHIDVLLCPLQHTPFNSFRSDIKLAECAVSNTAVLCDNFGPYQNTPFAVKSWEERLPELLRNPNLFNDYIPKPERYTTHLPMQRRLATIAQLITDNPHV